MILTTTQKFLVVLILVFIIGFLAYSTIGTGETVTEENATTEVVGVNGSDILALVDKFKTVSIEKDLFDSSLFKSLLDFAIPLTSEPQGRPNPFAPIGFDNFGSTIQSQSSTSTSSSSNR